MQPDDPQQRIDALTNTLNLLLQNQDELKQRVTHLESLLQINTQAPVALAPVNTQQPSPRPTVVETSGLTEVAAADRAEASSPQAPPTPPREAGLESKVGLTVVNRIGAITLVLGIAFFFKWAVDNNWIGPAGRVILGLLAGFAALAAGDYLWRKRQQVFAQGITGTGIAILYLAIYAAFDFYHLIPQFAAFILMVAITAMAAVLALRYGAFAIAALGLAGAYITPFLLSTGQDHPWFLFSYLLLLNFAATELAKRGSWPRLEIMSFAATTLIYGAWLLDRGTQTEKRLVATLAPLAFTAQRWRTQTPFLFALAQFLTCLAISLIWRPEEAPWLPLSLLLAAAGLAFARVRSYQPAASFAFVGFWCASALHLFHNSQPVAQFFGISCGFVLFLAWGYWQLILKRTSPSTLLLSIFSLNGVLFYAYSYSLLHASYHLWLGPLAALVAGVYLAFGIFLHRQRITDDTDNRPVLFSLGIAISFLTLAIPIQFAGFTITIAWAIQAGALSWIAYRFQNQKMAVSSMLVLALVALRLVLFEADMLPDPLKYSAIANPRFFVFFTSALGMLLASYWTSKVIPFAGLAAYFAGNFFMLWGLCLEILGWVARSAAPENQLSIETIAISILFGVYAVILVSIGVALRSQINRLTGLGLFGIVILKLYFFDVWQLGRPYQIAAFVILGILLLSTSFLYSHFRRLIETWWKDDQTPA